MSHFLWLARDSDDLVNWCRCDRSGGAAGGLVGHLPQMDCPRCGCGWLFSCVQCRKCFAFARAELIAGTIEDLARADFQAFLKRSPTDEELTEWVDSIQWMTEDLEVGDRVVVLDGMIIPADHEGPIEFEGWHSRHSLPWVPHVQALTHPEVEQEILSSQDYWTERELPHE